MITQTDMETKTQVPSAPLTEVKMQKEQEPL